MIVKKQTARKLSNSQGLGIQPRYEAYSDFWVEL